MTPTRYEWIKRADGAVEVRVHLEDGSYFILSQVQANKRYGIKPAHPYKSR